jgi:predicted Zn-dependent peptidase
MSSRLFQEIRGKRGLAYSIYSYIASYSDSGYLAVYLGVDRESVKESLTLILKEISNIQHQEVPEAELANARDFVKSGLFLSMENMETVMSRIAKNELHFGRYIPLEEVLDSIDRISPDDVLRVGSRIFGSRELTVAALGPLEEAGIDLKQ